MAYLGGMFNADGHFSLAIHHTGGHWYIEPAIIFTVNPNDEELILTIDEFLDDLDYHVKYTSTRKKSSPDVVTGINMRVERRDEVDNFAKRLYGYCYGNKAEQLRLYVEELIPIIGQKDSHRWTKELFLDAMKVVDKINALKTGDRGKYNYDYFLRLFTEDL